MDISRTPPPPLVIHMVYGCSLRCCKKSFQNPNPSFWVPDVRYQCYELSDQICLLSLICLYYKLYSTYMYFIHRLLSNNKEREMEGWLLSQSEHWFLWNISIIDSNFLYKNTRLCTHSNLKILLFFFCIETSWSLLHFALSCNAE